MSDILHDAKRKLINDFIYQFDTLEDASISKIKEGLRSILGEEPGIEFEYNKERQINEAGEWERDLKGHFKNIEKLKTIKIFYTYINEQNQLKVDHLKFIVN